MAQQSTSRWLVSTEWLAARLGQPDLVVVDGSFYLPAMKRDAAAEYLAGHIPGAVRFDIDEIADKSIALPHMLPSSEQFAQAVGQLGISERDTIVTILADYGTRYMSKLFDPKFLRSKDLPVPAWMERRSMIKVPYEKV